MKTIESTVLEVVRHPRFQRTAVVGFLMSFIPVFNFFVFGYLYKYARLLRQNQTNSLNFPKWSWSMRWLKEEAKEDFIEGAKAFLESCLFFFLPVVIGGFLGGCIDRCYLGGCLGMLVGIPLWARSFFCGDLLSDFRLKTIKERIVLVTKQAMFRYRTYFIFSFIAMALQLMFVMLAQSWVFLVPVLYLTMLFLIAHISFLEK